MEVKDKIDAQLDAGEEPYELKSSKPAKVKKASKKRSKGFKSQ